MGEKIKSMAELGFLNSRKSAARLDKLYMDLYNSLNPTESKQYYRGITVNIPYVKDVVFTTTTTDPVYDTQGNLVSPGSTTTTATKVTGEIRVVDGVVTNVT